MFGVAFVGACNVLKSATLLSATPERHSQNWEQRSSATPFFQNERCVSGTPFFAKDRDGSGTLYFTLLICSPCLFQIITIKNVVVIQ